MVGAGGILRGPGWAVGGAHIPPMGAAATHLEGEALSVALDVVQAWAVLITLGFTMILFFFLAMCVCAKKEDLYEDYESTIGVTTLKMCQDGGENGMRSFSQLNGSHTPRASDEASEASSRATLKRELPAIPLSTDPDPTMECHMDRSGSQHSSDLYAAVPEMTQGPTSGSKVKGGVQVLPTGALGPGGRAAILRETTPSSDSDQGDARTEGLIGHGGVAHPYAKVKKNHPYAHVKLTKKEHPYAKVGRGDSEDPETDTDNYDDPNIITKKSNWQGESMYEPPPPVPEKRFELLEEKPVEAAAPEPGPSSPRLTTSSAHSPVSPRGLAPAEPGSPKRSPSEDIPAAMAISGLAPANEELPYMTPPLHHQSPIDPQPNFSGDSQDSRGYTSISVREPLANLKAQGPAPPLQPLMQGLEGEGYYMTVSDDSADEMYACIYEGGQGGVGSETYAQIEPRTASPPPPFPTVTSSQTSSSQSVSVVDTGMTSSQPPPAPPSVDSLRHVLHSRQASSSSAASTVIGSPGVEKRGTKSPLPPLPQGTTDLYSSPSPPLSPRPIERPTQRALEEMYAKVMKKQRPGHSRDSSSGGGAISDGGSEDASSRRGSVDTTGGIPHWPAHVGQQPSNSTPRQSLDLGSMTHSLIETRNADIIIPMSRAKSYDASVLGSSWQHATPPITSDPNYETIPQHTMASYYSGGSSDHGYETVKKKEPPYASVEGHVEGSYPNYETVETGSREEPGYETLKHKEYEPGYETVQQGTTEPSYESVVGQPNLYEPGYEMVKHEQIEAGYESVRTEAKEDPGYEELKGGTRPPCTTSEHDPNYEQLKFGIGGEEPGYEEVSKAEAVEGTYECMKDYTTQYQPYEQTSEVEQPLYASVKRKGSEGPEQQSAMSLQEEIEKAIISPEEEGGEPVSTSLVQPCAAPVDIGLPESETRESVQKQPPLPLTVSFDMSSIEERKQSIGSSDMDSPVKEQSSSSESPEMQEYPAIRSPIKSMSPDAGSPILTKSPLLVDVGERPVSFTSIEIRRSPSIGSSDMESPDKPKSTDDSEFPEAMSLGSPVRQKSPPVDRPEEPMLPTFESWETSCPTSMASPDKSRPTSMASPDKSQPILDRSQPTSIASPDKSWPVSVASPDKSQPTSTMSPDKSRPTSMTSPDRSRPSSMGSTDRSRPASMASPDRSQVIPKDSLDKSLLLESGSPDRSRPVSVSSPDKPGPVSVASPDVSGPLSVEAPDKFSSVSSTGGPEIPVSAASPVKWRSPSIGSSDMDSPEKPSSPCPGSPEKVLPPPPLMTSYVPSPPPPEQTSSPPPPPEQISSTPSPPPPHEEISSPPPPPPLLEESPSPIPPEKIPSPPPPEKIPSPPPPPPLESEQDTSPLPPSEILMPSEVPTRTVPSPALVSVSNTSAASNDLTDVRMESPEALPPPPHSSSTEAAALGEEEEFPPSPPEFQMRVT
ncbi:uncharacterized protein LOC143026572 isoform X2 [Oratosquilla oratoria]|uniref:uncharacterized protein LOC143026572 isoform X2 n=1 Tax=Oratosquilla oratoria TaxID=337810 RepID=UPI003F760547